MAGVREPPAVSLVGVAWVLSGGGGRGSGGGGGEGGGGRGGRGVVHGGFGPLPRDLGPYPFLLLAALVAEIGGYWLYLRSRR